MTKKQINNKIALDIKHLANILLHGEEDFNDKRKKDFNTLINNIVKLRYSPIIKKVEVIQTDKNKIDNKFTLNITYYEWRKEED